MNLIYVFGFIYVVLIVCQFLYLRAWIKRYERNVKNLAIQTASMANTQYGQALLVGSLAERVTSLEPKEESEG